LALRFFGGDAGGVFRSRARPFKYNASGEPSPCGWPAKEFVGLGDGVVVLLVLQRLIALGEDDLRRMRAAVLASAFSARLPLPPHPPASAIISDSATIATFRIGLVAAKVFAWEK
jgi:hypothetical protein